MAIVVFTNSQRSMDQSGAFTQAVNLGFDRSVPPRCRVTRCEMRDTVTFGVRHARSRRFSFSFHSPSRQLGGTNELTVSGAITTTTTTTTTRTFSRGKLASTSPDDIRAGWRLVFRSDPFKHVRQSSRRLECSNKCWSFGHLHQPEHRRSRGSSRGSSGST